MGKFLPIERLFILRFTFRYSIMQTLKSLIFEEEDSRLSAGAKKAQSMGLEKKPGIGSYGPPGKDIITHRVRAGELVPVKGGEEQPVEKTPKTGEQEKKKEEKKKEGPKTQIDLVSAVQDGLRQRLATPSPGQLLKLQKKREAEEKKIQQQIQRATANKETFRERTNFVDNYLQTKFPQDYAEMVRFSQKYLNNANMSEVIAEYLDVIGGHSPTTKISVTVTKHGYLNSETLDFSVEDNEIFMQRVLHATVLNNNRKNLKLYNAMLTAPPDMQGSNIAKKSLSAMLRVGDRLGITKANLNAGLAVGGYAWIKAGAIVNDPQSLCRTLADRLNDFDNFRTRKIENLNRDIQYGTDRLHRELTLYNNTTDPDIKELLRIDIQKSGEYIRSKEKLRTFMEKTLITDDDSDLRNTFTSLINRAVFQSDQFARLVLYRLAHTPLGKAMLLGQGWDGYYDLKKNSRGRRRIEKYIGNFNELINEAKQVSRGALKAKEMGLEKKPGIGLYGPEGKDLVTHRVRGGELVPVKGDEELVGDKQKGSEETKATGGEKGGKEEKEKKIDQDSVLGVIQAMQSQIIDKLATPAPGDIGQLEIPLNRGTIIQQEIDTKMQTFQYILDHFKTFLDDPEVTGIDSEILQLSMQEKQNDLNEEFVQINKELTTLANDPNITDEELRFISQHSLSQLIFKARIDPLKWKDRNVPSLYRIRPKGSSGFAIDNFVYNHDISLFKRKHPTYEETKDCINGVLGYVDISQKELDNLDMNLFKIADTYKLFVNQISKLHRHIRAITSVKYDNAGNATFPKELLINSGFFQDYHNIDIDKFLRELDDWSNMDGGSVNDPTSTVDSYLAKLKKLIEMSTTSKYMLFNFANAYFVFNQQQPPTEYFEQHLFEFSKQVDKIKRLLSNSITETNADSIVSNKLRENLAKTEADKVKLFGLQISKTLRNKPVVNDSDDKAWDAAIEVEDFDESDTDKFDNPAEYVSPRTLIQYTMLKTMLSDIKHILPENSRKKITKFVASVSLNPANTIDGELRAHYSWERGNVIQLDRDDTDIAGTFTHEFGHMIERCDESILTKSIYFLVNKIFKHNQNSTQPQVTGMSVPNQTTDGYIFNLSVSRNEFIQKLKDKYPSHGYKDHEVYIDAGFKSDYTSKIYHGIQTALGRTVNGNIDVPDSDAEKYYMIYLMGSGSISDIRLGASEILSMGLQQMFTDPIAFYKEEPEFFKYIMAILKG